MLIPSIHERKSWLGFILFFVVGLNLYFNFTYRGGLEERADWIDGVFGRLLMPIQFIVSVGQESAGQSVRSFAEMWGAIEKNQELQAQLRLQQTKLQQLENLKLENERLRQLLGFQENLPVQYLAAEVIGKDPSPFFQSVMLDRGSEDGVEVGMPVLSQQGVVGRIESVTDFSSRVLLITDINSRLDAVVERSRARVIVTGRSDSSFLGLRFLPRRQDLIEGDRIISSGLEGGVPAGFIIGSVSSLDASPHRVLQDAKIEPAVEFDKLEEVFILREQQNSKG